MKKEQTRTISFHTYSLYFLMISAFIFQDLSAQSKKEKEFKAITWKQMADVTFETKWDDLIGTNLLFPIFGDSLKMLENKRVRISGYVIPMDISGEMIVLSSNPFTSCFFCGGAGPETVMELELRKTSKTFRTDEFFMFEGLLLLNRDDINHLNYLLKDAVWIDPEK